MPSLSSDVFFMYDNQAVQKESDDPKDAIVFFYPHKVSVDDQIALCGQLMGLMRMIKSLTGSSPSIVNLHTVKYALKQIDNRYIVALSCARDVPDSIAKEQMAQLLDTFTFYHCNMENISKTLNDEQEFCTHAGAVWQSFVPFVRCYGNDVAAGFGTVPMFHLPKAISRVYLQASHLLQICQRRPGVLAGSVVFGRQVVCTQFKASVNKKLLLIRPSQHNLPARTITTDFKLPVGVRLLSVYLTVDEIKHINPHSPLLHINYLLHLCDELENDQSTNVENALKEHDISREGRKISFEDSYTSTETGPPMSYSPTSSFSRNPSMLTSVSSFTSNYTAANECDELSEQKRLDNEMPLNDCTTRNEDSKELKQDLMEINAKSEAENITLATENVSMPEGNKATSSNEKECEDHTLVSQLEENFNVNQSQYCDNSDECMQSRVVTNHLEVISDYKDDCDDQENSEQPSSAFNLMLHDLDIDKQCFASHNATESVENVNVSLSPVSDIGDIDDVTPYLNFKVNLKDESDYFVENSGNAAVENENIVNLQPVCSSSLNNASSDTPASLQPSVKVIPVPAVRISAEDEVLSYSLVDVAVEADENINFSLESAASCDLDYVIANVSGTYLSKQNQYDELDVRNVQENVSNTCLNSTVIQNIEVQDQFSEVRDDYSKNRPNFVEPLDHSRDGSIQVEDMAHKSQNSRKLAVRRHKLEPCENSVNGATKSTVDHQKINKRSSVGSAFSSSFSSLDSCTSGRSSSMVKFVDNFANMRTFSKCSASDSALCADSQKSCCKNDLVNVCVYVCEVERTLLVLLTELHICQRPEEIINDLYEFATETLQDLNRQLKQTLLLETPSLHGKSKDFSYRWLVYSDEEKSLEGAPLEPVTYAEQAFCDEALKLHAELQRNKDVVEIMHRSTFQHIVVHRDEEQEIYFSPKLDHATLSSAPIASDPILNAELQSLTILKEEHNLFHSHLDQ